MNLYVWLTPPELLIIRAEDEPDALAKAHAMLEKLYEGRERTEALRQLYTARCVEVKEGQILTSGITAEDIIQ